jgi:hypothetical protein
MTGRGKGGKGLGKGGAKRRKTYFWYNLRRNTWRLKGILRKCHQGCSNIHRTRKEKNRNSHGRRLRFKTSRTYFIWIWRLR